MIATSEIYKDNERRASNLAAEEGQA